MKGKYLIIMDYTLIHGNINQFYIPSSITKDDDIDKAIDYIEKEFGYKVKNGEINWIWCNHRQTINNY